MLIFFGGFILLSIFVTVSVYIKILNLAKQNLENYKKRLDAGEISDDWKHTERALAGGILFSGGLCSAYTADIAYQFVKILDERPEVLSKHKGDSDER